VRRLLSRFQLGVVAAFALLLVIMIVVGALIGGAFDAGDGGSAPASGTPAGSAFPAGHHGGSQAGVNRQLLECLRDQGIEITSPEDVYSAPPEALQSCGHHAGGGAP
jgi:hypothetical protein